jgi:hypothetical protein
MPNLVTRLIREPDKAIRDEPDASHFEVTGLQLDARESSARLP